MGDNIYADVETLRTMLAPKMGEARFRAVLKELEAAGFPQADPVFGGRYLPAVRAWLDLRHGLIKAAVPVVVDGQENWDNGNAGRNAGARPEKTSGRDGPLLAGKECQPEGRGIPRPDDTLAARRKRSGNI